MSVLDIYNQLVEIASKGGPFRWDQVYHVQENTDPAQAASVLGNGYDFSRTIQVPDVNAAESGATVKATIEFRIIAKDDQRGTKSLFLRTWLIWTPTGATEQYKSYASYDITPAAAIKLAESVGQPQPGEDIQIPEGDPQDMSEEQIAELVEDVAEALFGYMSNASTYGAQWAQTPSDEDLMSAYDLGSMSPEEIEGITAYQEKVIVAVQLANPVLCMLSYDSMGVVEPGELTTLHDWLLEQPELALVK